MPPQEHLPNLNSGTVGSAPIPPSAPAEDIPTAADQEAASKSGSGIDWDEFRAAVQAACGEADYDRALQLTEAALQTLRKDCEPNLIQLCSAFATAAQIQECRNENASAADLWREALQVTKEPRFPDPLILPDLLDSLAQNLLRQSGGLKSELRTEAKRTLNLALEEFRLIYQSFPEQFPTISGEERDELIITAKCGAVEALKQFSELCSELQLHRAAEHFAQKACMLCDKLLGPEDPLAFKARWTLMNCARELKRYEQEELVIQRSLEYAPQPQAASESAFLILQGRLADCMVRQKKFDQAYALAKPLVSGRSVEGMDELAKSAMSFLHRALGSVAANLKDWPEAKKQFACSIAFEELRDSISIGYLNGLQFSLARAMLRIAATTEDAQIEQAEEAAAETIYKAAAMLTDQDSVGPTPEGIRAHRKLFDFYYERERFKEADQQAVILQQLTKLVYGSESAQYVDSFQWRSTVLAAMGKYGRAEAIAQQALEIAQKLPDDSQDCVVNIYKELAGLVGESGATASAIEYLTEGVQFALKLRGPNSFLLAQARLNLADEYIEAGEHSKAEKEARFAKATLDRFPPNSMNSHELGRTFHILGCCAAEDQDSPRRDEAFNHYEQAEEAFAAARSGKTLTYAHFLVDSGWLYAERFDSTRDPEDCKAALLALRQAEGMFRNVGLDISQAQLELVEKVIELLELDGDDTAASQYRELAGQLKLELGPPPEDDQDSEAELS